MIKMLTELIRSYCLAQIELIPLTSMLTHWIFRTVIFDWRYNEKDISNNKILYVFLVVQIFKHLILYQYNRTLLTYLSIFGGGFDKKGYNFKMCNQHNPFLQNNRFKYYENSLLYNTVDSDNTEKLILFYSDDNMYLLHSLWLCPI